MVRVFGVIGLWLWSSLAFGQIRVSESVYNLGDIFENRGKVTAKFNLQNPFREDTIRILDIVTSCGCTAVLTEDTLILPSSTITLDVTYDPSNRLGLFVKSIELTTYNGGGSKDKLYLKIIGNVISESFVAKQTNSELLAYNVAPIYFYPVTAFDTSYLDFNFIIDFVNDLTYEVDFYQFANVGIEIEVADIKQVEEMEHLVGFSKKKIIREFQRRGFKGSAIFFDEPIFKKSTDLPPWANAMIRLYSVNFDAEGADTSVIKVSANEEVATTKLLLDYERFALPEIEEIIAAVNFETIEGKLFLNGSMNLNGTILMPWKKSEKVRTKTAGKLKKAIQKRIKETTGATKKEVHISFDSLGVHPENKFQFLLWDQADEEEEKTMRYVIKPDKITRPQLPTYKQFYGSDKSLDTASFEFKHFWKNCILNHESGHAIKFLIEYACSSEPHDMTMGNTEFTRVRAELLQSELEKLFKAETNGGELEIILKGAEHGPQFKLSKRYELLDHSQFDYFTIIPLVHHTQKNESKAAKPYMVNFDYFFKGIDTGAHGFQVFANELAKIVKQDGYVELRMESSISKIPIDKRSSNLFLAYQRLVESQRRLRAAMAFKLIDPNRVIFTDELVVEQGPKYDGTIPILKYRKFHYIRIVPEKSLQHRSN